MGDDPHFPAIENQSSSNGNTIINHYSISTGQLVVLVVVAGLSLGLSIGAVALMIHGQDATRQQIDAVERRVMDRAGMAEREARIAQDEIQRLQVELKVSTNH